MASRRHISAIVAVVACLTNCPWGSGIVFASEASSASDVQSSLVASTDASEPPNAIAVAFTEASLSRAVSAAAVAPYASQRPFAFVPVQSTAFAQRGYGGRGYGGGRSSSAVVIALGAAAAIAGTAVLVYANRPECSTSPVADGCGYGTKVVGGAVLSAGLVTVLVGALTWR